jgi:hypothetical protein
LMCSAGSCLVIYLASDQLRPAAWERDSTRILQKQPRQKEISPLQKIYLLS